MTEKPMHFPQPVKNAMGELIVYVLGQGLDVDGGAYLSMDNITIGNSAEGTPLGDWKVTIQRRKKP